VTFSPPKSVSVLWALGSEVERHAVLEAHRVAVPTGSEEARSSGRAS